MTLELTTKKLLTVLAIALVGAAGLALGYSTYRQSHRPWPANAQLQARLQQPGTAPVPVQDEVRALLSTFQAGYLQRDPALIDNFMAAHFDPSADLLILGTDSDEWVRGPEQAKQFIRADWLGWGALRLDVSHAIVSSDTQTAWLATMGTVSFKRITRPLRFTAILVRGVNGWRFRQMQFQWEGGSSF